MHHLSILSRFYGSYGKSTLPRRNFEGDDGLSLSKMPWDFQVAIPVAKYSLIFVETLTTARARFLTGKRFIDQRFLVRSRSNGTHSHSVLRDVRIPNFWEKVLDDLGTFLLFSVLTNLNLLFKKKV